jgi:fibronectin-binding autotransporter adhesin
VVSHLANGALDIAASVSGLTFDFGPSSGVESIKGYAPGADSFDISHTLFSSFSEMMSHAEQQGHNVVIDYGAADTLTLTGVTLSELNAHASDFHFV